MRSDAARPRGRAGRQDARSCLRDSCAASRVPDWPGRRQRPSAPRECSGVSTPSAALSVEAEEDCRTRLVQPVLILELARQILPGEVLEVLVGERVELDLEPARQHPLDLLLPVLLLEPAVAEELTSACGVLLVELDPDIPRQNVRFGIGAREPDELRLRDRHPLALEGEVDRSLLDDGVDVLPPRVVVDE